MKIILLNFKQTFSNPIFSTLQSETLKNISKKLIKSKYIYIYIIQKINGEKDRTKLTNSMPNTEPNKASKQYLKDKFGAALKCTKGTNASLEVQNPCSYVQVLTLGTPL